MKIVTRDTDTEYNQENHNKTFQNNENRFYQVNGEN